MTAEQKCVTPLTPKPTIKHDPEPVPPTCQPQPNIPSAFEAVFSSKYSMHSLSPSSYPHAEPTVTSRHEPNNTTYPV
jgi:hypothetical protein